MKKEDLKIVFLGTPDFAVASLDRLVTEGYNIAAVVTMPDKRAGRGHGLFQSPVKEYALAHNLPVLQPERLKDEAFVNALRLIDADLFIVIAFRMLPEVVWRMPRLGTFNLHASLLPRYRGAAPINHAVMNGDAETGVTTFFLKHEIDTGDILRQERITIGPDENVGSVHDRLMELGAELTVDTVRHILKGDLTPMPQDELLGDEEPTPAPASTSTSWPARVMDATPDGLAAMRCSPLLISRGIPMRMGAPGLRATIAGGEWCAPSIICGSPRRHQPRRRTRPTAPAPRWR